MIFAEVVVVAPLATLPHDPLACLGSFLLCLLAAWISNTIVWALFPPYLPPSLPCCLSTRPFFIVKKLLTLMLSTCKKKVNNICSLAIEVTFHTLAKPHHLLNLLLSQSTPVSPSPLVKRSIASRHLSAKLATSGDFWLTFLSLTSQLFAASWNLYPGKLYLKLHWQKKGGIKYQYKYTWNQLSNIKINIKSFEYPIELKGRLPLKQIIPISKTGEFYI